MEQPDSTPTCPICGRFIDPNTEKCPECGFQLKKKIVTPEAVKPRGKEPYLNSPANSAKKNFPVWAWILIVVAVLGCLAFCVLGTGLAGILMWRSEPEPTESIVPTRVPQDDELPLPPEENEPPVIEEDDGGGAIIEIPTLAPADSYDEVTVEETWFLQDKNNPNLFYYGFVLKNPNPDVVIENINLQAVAYDTEDTILGTGTTYAGAVLPGQELAIPGYGITIPEGSKVNRLEVKVVEPGRATQLEIESNPFTFDKVKYYEDTYYATATGLMNYSGSEPVTGVTVSAVGYDAGGNIVGINSSYESLYVEPGVDIPVSVAMSFNEAPSEVEFFATYSPSGQYGLDNGGALPRVAAWGYSVDSGRYVNYAIALKNPTDAELYQYLSCRVVVYDTDGSVVAINSDLINSIFPGEKQALAGGISLPAGINYDQIDRIDVIVQPPSYESNVLGMPSDGLTQNPLSFGDITYFPGDYTSKVTTEMKNSSDYTISAVVTAVLYDESGTIIGGAKAYPSAVPPGEKIAIEVPFYQDVQPDKVELFASITSVE